MTEDDQVVLMEAAGQLGEMGAVYRVAAAADQTLARLQAATGRGLQKMLALLLQSAQADLERLPAGSQDRLRLAAMLLSLRRGLGGGAQDVEEVLAPAAADGDRPAP